MNRQEEARARQREEERLAIEAASERLLAGRPINTSSTDLTIKNLAEEALLGRHFLTIKHVDLAEAFQKKKAELLAASPRSNAAHSQADDLNKTIKDQRAELKSLKNAKESLAAQLAVATLRIQELEDLVPERMRGWPQVVPGIGQPGHPGRSDDSG